MCFNIVCEGRDQIHAMSGRGVPTRQIRSLVASDTMNWGERVRLNKFMGDAVVIIQISFIPSFREFCNQKLLLCCLVFLFEKSSEILNKF